MNGTSWMMTTKVAMTKSISTMLEMIMKKGRTLSNTYTIWRASSSILKRSDDFVSDTKAFYFPTDHLPLIHTILRLQ